MTEKSLNLLRSLHLASVSDPGYLYTTKKDHKELAELGYVSVDGCFHDGGVGFMRKFATGITDEGVKFLFGNVETNDDIKPVIESTRIEETRSNVMSENLFTREPLAKATRKTERESDYPFEKMLPPDLDGVGNVVDADTWYSEVGDDVVGKVQSRVGAFNRKHSEPTGMYRTMQRKQKDGTVADVSVEIRKPIKKLSVIVGYTEENEPYAKVQRVL